MTDLKISAWVTLAYGLWVMAFTLVLVSRFTPARLGQLGLLLAGMAMVLNVRSFFCALHRREQAAFDLGAESVRVLNLQR